MNSPVFFFLSGGYVPLKYSLAPVEYEATFVFSKLEL